MSLVSNFHDLILKNRISINAPVIINELDVFEKVNNVKFPSDLRDYFSILNGFCDGELLGLSNFWPLQKMIPVTKLPGFDLNLSTDLKEAIEKKYLYDSNSDGGNKVITASHEWLLTWADAYFVFGDYNVNSCYWAINLSAEKERHGAGNVICIYVWGNNYKYVAASFSEFVNKFIEEGEEALI